MALAFHRETRKPCSGCFRQLPLTCFSCLDLDRYSERPPDLSNYAEYCNRCKREGKRPSLRVPRKTREPETGLGRARRKIRDKIKAGTMQYPVCIVCRDPLDSVTARFTFYSKNYKKAVWYHLTCRLEWRKMRRCNGCEKWVRKSDCSLWKGCLCKSCEYKQLRIQNAEVAKKHDEMKRQESIVSKKCKSCDLMQDRIHKYSRGNLSCNDCRAYDKRLETATRKSSTLRTLMEKKIGNETLSERIARYRHGHLGGL